MKISCHCHNIEIEVPPPDQLTVCNCSICSRYQALWGYYQPAAVRVNVGEAGEQFYTWNDHEIEFVRCSGCGCVTYYRVAAGLPDPKIAVNFRMAPAELLTDVPVRYFNGKELL
jgi:hypothetical protein